MSFPPPSPIALALDAGAPLTPASPGSDVSVPVVNPRDGAVIVAGPDRVVARADDGDRLTFYPRTLDYGFRRGGVTLADLADGTIAVGEAGRAAAVDADGAVYALGGGLPERRLGSLRDPRFRLRAALSAAGLRDPLACVMLGRLYRARRDLSRVADVRADFDRSTDALLEAAQRAAIRAAYGGAPGGAAGG